MKQFASQNASQNRAATYHLNIGDGVRMAHDQTVSKSRLNTARICFDGTAHQGAPGHCLGHDVKQVVGDVLF